MPDPTNPAVQLLDQVIQLPRGDSVLVDGGDFAYLTQWKWCLLGRSHKQRYASRTEPGSRQKFLMHRVIMGVTDPAIRVDHRNGDTLDNRRSNLRLATPTQNGRNAGLISSNTSGYIGVSRDKGTGRWQAKIKDQGRQIYLGQFDDPVSAALARDEAARRIDSEFFRLNFPDQVTEVPDHG